MHAQSSAASIRLTSKPCRHPRDAPDAGDGGGNDDWQAQKKPRSDATKDNSRERLRFVYSTLKDQFDQIEAIYEGNKGSFEISTDCGEEGGTLVCTVTVQLDDSTAMCGEISVECADEKLAQNVRSCIRNVVEATVPIQS